MSAGVSLAKIRFVQVSERQGGKRFIAVFLTVALLAMLLGAYIGVMHAVVDVSRVTTDRDADERDLAYVYLHLAMLTGAGIIGFFAGKWVNGLGIAFATLFVIVMSIGMLSVQLSSYELACHGHNNLVRQWQC